MAPFLMQQRGTGCVSEHEYPQPESGRGRSGEMSCFYGCGDAVLLGLPALGVRFSSFVTVE